MRNLAAVRAGGGGGSFNTQDQSREEGPRLRRFRLALASTSAALVRARKPHRRTVPTGRETRERNTGVYDRSRG